MNDRDRARLGDMLHYARKAVDLVGTSSGTELDANEDRVLALIAALTILGEASAQLSPALHDAWPDVPWRRIKDLRNVIVHRYFEIRTDELVDTVTRRLPDVIADIDRILAEGDETT